MKTIDLTRYGTQTVSFYLALERFLLNDPAWRSDDLFFIWDKHPAIVCGKHQLIPNEVNLEHAARIGVPVYRRHSGGGTIFADQGCFMFTFIRRTSSRDRVFAESLAEIQRAFALIGLDVEISGRNDLLFRGRKFSGNAYYRNEHGSILHGTLLFDTDIEQLVRSITPDNEKLISKGIESVRQRVINVGDYTSLTRTEMMRHLEHAIAPDAVPLSDADHAAVLAIEPEYLTPQWIDGNNPPYTFVAKRRFDFGLIQAAVDVKQSTVRNIQFTGDFFTHEDLAPLCSALVGCPFTRTDIEACLLSNPVDRYILGATNHDILSLLFD